jgi:hypothetical protein
MKRIRPEYLDSDPSDRSVAADVLLCDKSHTREKTKRKTRTTAKKMTMMTTKTKTANFASYWGTAALIE